MRPYQHFVLLSTSLRDTRHQRYDTSSMAQGSMDTWTKTERLHDQYRQHATALAPWHKRCKKQMEEAWIEGCMLSIGSIAHRGALDTWITGWLKGFAR